VLATVIVVLRAEEEMMASEYCARKRERPKQRREVFGAITRQYWARLPGVTRTTPIPKTGRRYRGTRRIRTGTAKTGVALVRPVAE
jgi:hypothetical protein